MTEDTTLKMENTEIKDEEVKELVSTETTETPKEKPEETVVTPEETPAKEVKPEQKGRYSGKRTQGNFMSKEEIIDAWKPKTALGKKVKEGLITDIDEIFDSGEKILEAEIVDMLLPDLETDLLLIGQAKGKFGGGKRRIFRQTQKKTKEGNKLQFTTCALVGNKNGYIGVSVGKSKETVPARDKSIRQAKLTLMKIRRGCGSWECTCGGSHSIPFEVEGKCGSSIMKLIPAPKGKGLCIEKECAKILQMAGIKDIWSMTKGQTKTKLNLIKALVQALYKLSGVKIQTDHKIRLGVTDGKFKASDSEIEMKEFAESTNVEETKESEEKTEEVKEEVKEEK